MDAFTHLLLPYTLARTFKKHIEKSAAFAFGGITPDFDILIVWINYVYPSTFLIVHRGITHSIFFGFVTVLIALFVFTRKKVQGFLINRVHKDLEIVSCLKMNRTAVMYAFAGVLMHIALDGITTRGIPVLFPLVTTRYSAELFFFIDFYLMILSAIFLIVLIGREYVNQDTLNKTHLADEKVLMKRMFFAYIIVLLVLGGARWIEKEKALDFYQDKNKIAFPTSGIFNWFVLSGNDTGIKVYEYDGRNNVSISGSGFLRLDLHEMYEINRTFPFERADALAQKLPQVWMFKWAAYSTAINASYSSGTWFIEYYDPVRKAQFRNISGFFPRQISRMGSVRVEVSEQGAKVVK